MGWIPIGTDNAPFIGSFEGNGFKITDLYISSDLQSVGLFGVNNGDVKNLGVETAQGSISASSGSGSNYIGGIAGKNLGTITNSYSTGKISASSSSYIFSSGAGGIVGENAGTITNSYSIGDVSAFTGVSTNGYAYAGGIAGRTDSGIITNSVAANKNVAATAENAQASTAHIGRIVAGTLGFFDVSNNFADSDMLLNENLAFDSIT
ncbi:MAG: hypothetical protein LBH45_03800 [Campylobacteraceae bacterium]|nr:hypothetical protein [Campylobacteraceae bacterium]